MDTTPMVDIPFWAISRVGKPMDPGNTRSKAVNTTPKVIAQMIGFSETLNSMFPFECWACIRRNQVREELPKVKLTSNEFEKEAWMASLLQTINFENNCYFVMSGFDKLAWFRLHFPEGPKGVSIFLRGLIRDNVLLASLCMSKVIEITTIDDCYVAYLHDFKDLRPNLG